MQVAGAAGRGKSVVQHFLRIADSLRAHQSLCRHEISSCVVGVVLQQNREFRESAVEVALLGILHGEPVAREGVLRILSQDLVERGDAVHRSTESVKKSVETSR